MVKYEMMQPKTMQLTTNKLLRVETNVGRFFHFFKNRESWFFEYFSESKNCQFQFFGEKQFKIKKPLKNLKELTNFHEGICQDPMSFWPFL